MEHQDSKERSGEKNVIYCKPRPTAMKLILLFLCLHTISFEKDNHCQSPFDLAGFESQNQIMFKSASENLEEAATFSEFSTTDFSQKTNLFGTLKSEFKTHPMGFFPGCGSEMVKQLHDLGIAVKSYQDLKAALEEIDALIGEVF